jgi:hypothetical protein
MAITGFSGPLVSYGLSSSGAAIESTVSNPSQSPSIFDQGIGILDPRVPYAYQPGRSNDSLTGADPGAYGWWGTSPICICNQVPSTLSTVSIAAAQVPVAGTKLTLVSATGGGITVGTSITSATTRLAVTGLLAIDVAMAPVRNGSSGGNLFWDPTKALARTLQILSVGDDHLATVTVAGYDVYSYPMTETITLTNASTATGKKAFKYITSITPAGTLSGANISVGQSDTIGLLMRCDLFQFLKIYSPDTTLISATTGFTAAVTTSPATAITGDVRGTFALQTASNNTRRLVIFLELPLANIGTAAGLVGVTQF